MPALNSITFVWPWMLWLLLLIPLCVCIYLFAVFRSRKSNSLSASTSTALRTSSPLHRYLCNILLLLGVSFLIVCLARPKASMLLPTRIDSIMIAVDTSGSMQADDIAPSRIEAAKTTIKQFIAAQPTQVKLGIVTIASTAALIQAPTADRDELNRVIENLPLQAGSALGSGILIALTELIPGTGIDVQKILTESNQSTGPTDSGTPLDMIKRPKESARLEPGSNKSVAIVLLSDGDSNFGPDPIKMSQLAADLGVRIYTVGIGTPAGAVLKLQGMSARVKLNESNLKQIAENTFGIYYRAATEVDIQQIYRALSASIRLEKHQTTEISALFLGLGLLLVLAACLASFSRNGRIV